MMYRIAFSLLIVLNCFLACKTSDTPVQKTTPTEISTAVVSPEPSESKSATASVSSTTDTDLSQEEAYRVKAFLKQAEAQYAAGAYREALQFYKKAESIAPDQVDRAKMIACLKAMQEPSTRRSGQ